MDRLLAVLVLPLFVTACATRLDNAPVIDRSHAHRAVNEQAPEGYYRVEPGDTLYRIARAHGQSVDDIANWNGLEDPSQIAVGQLLRVARNANLTAGVSTAPVTGGVVQAQSLSDANTRAITQPQSQPQSSPPVSSDARPVPSPLPPSSPNTPPNLNPAPASDLSAPQAPEAGAITLIWPVQGHGLVLAHFDRVKNKGIDIGGKSGAAIKAAAGGRVVYAGNGLRGYGNLIILKHDALFLSAYAHNRLLLVKEGDIVAKGQKIAEMGDSDAPRVMLHFEVRRQGKPVDPLIYLR